jgi:predicted amidohydrolase
MESRFGFTISLPFSTCERMPRTELIRHLENLHPPTPEGCLVLLWSYFETADLGKVENYLRSKSIHPLAFRSELPGGPIRARLPAAIRELGQLEGPDFDVYALRWLTSLDRDLKDRRGRRLDRLALQGLGQQMYWLRRRNDFLAEYYHPGVTWEADQSRSLSTYTRFHKAVPAEAIEGITINCRPESSWGNRRLHLRLLEERTRFRVLIWPLQVVLDYPALDALRADFPPEFVCLDRIRNESDLEAEVREALQTAGGLEVTLLILPELAVPPATEAKIRNRLAGHGPDGFPILTLFGRCHRRTPKGDLDLNEAVLLGPDGGELHRHRKLTAFTGFSEDRAHHFGERLEVGNTVTVLECALGNLAPLICLDLLHLPLAGILRRSHANVFPVPSLSPQTSAHRTAARQVQASNRAGTFVCNRWIDGLSEQGTSFYQVPRRNGYRAHLPDSGKTPYLLFEL